jgi:hypothetical protein
MFNKRRMHGRLCARPLWSTTTTRSNVKHSAPYAFFPVIPVIPRVPAPRSLNPRQPHPIAWCHEGVCTMPMVHATRTPLVFHFDMYPHHNKLPHNNNTIHNQEAKQIAEITKRTNKAFIFNHAPYAVMHIISLLLRYIGYKWTSIQLTKRAWSMWRVVTGMQPTHILLGQKQLIIVRYSSCLYSC